LLAIFAAPLVEPLAAALALLLALADVGEELVVGVKAGFVAAVLATVVVVMSLTPYTRMSTPVPTPNSRA
jgi:hypothetical protein